MITGSLRLLIVRRSGLATCNSDLSAFLDAGSSVRRYRRTHTKSSRWPELFTSELTRVLLLEAGRSYLSPSEFGSNVQKELERSPPFLELNPGAGWHRVARRTYWNPAFVFPPQSQWGMEGEGLVASATWRALRDNWPFSSLTARLEAEELYRPLLRLHPP